MSVMLQTPSRASSASSASFNPVSRQNTMSSVDGSRSARQSKRYSVTALYLSISANERDLEIEDDLAKGVCLRDLGVGDAGDTDLEQLRRYCAI
jgi:Ras GTPase-activating-like protein IQGAP2/3